MISTFEIICQKHALLFSTEKTNFQYLYETRKFFKKNLGIYILSNIDRNEELTLRRIFQKRHLFTHSSGIIEDKYIKKIPEDPRLYGQKAELSLDEFQHGVNIMRKVLQNLIDKTT